MLITTDPILEYLTSDDKVNSVHLLHEVLDLILKQDPNNFAGKESILVSKLTRPDDVEGSIPHIIHLTIGNPDVSVKHIVDHVIATLRKIPKFIGGHSLYMDLDKDHELCLTVNGSVRKDLNTIVRAFMKVQNLLCDISTYKPKGINVLFIDIGKKYNNDDYTIVNNLLRYNKNTLIFYIHRDDNLTNGEEK